MKSILTGSLVTLAIATAAMPVAALPDQAVGEVLLWSRKHLLISPLGFAVKLQTVEPDLVSVSRCQNTQLSFSVWAQQEKGRSWCDPRGCIAFLAAKVTQELLDYRRIDNDVRFERNNPAGLSIVEQVYGPRIVKDFQQSQLVYQGKKNPISVYGGKLYGYTGTSFVSHGNQEYAAQLKVVPLNQLNTEIQTQKLSESSLKTYTRE